MHIGLDIDASYPAILMLAAVLSGIMWRRWRRLPGRVGGRVWIVAMVPVLVLAVSLYQSDVWGERGRLAQAEEDYSTAVEYFGRATAGVVYNPDLLSAEAINRLGLGAPEQLNVALAEARQAQSEDSHDGQHWQLEGRILQARGDLAGAERSFRHALELDPLNHPDYALDLATVQEKAGRAGDALATARHMLGLHRGQAHAADGSQ
jgi:Flp pilus assembly protein TadD